MSPLRLCDKFPHLIATDSFSPLCFVCLFCCFKSQSNSYGHGGTVSSPNHTFSWASLNKQLTSTSCTYFRLQLTTTLLEWFSGRKENDRRNHFMINLHESMGPGRDRTRDPWICSQTRICCQTRYRLRYAARFTSLRSENTRISLLSYRDLWLNYKNCSCTSKHMTQYNLS